MSEYTAEMIKRIDDLRAEGLSWAEVATEINQVYSTNKTGNALSKAYKAHFQEDSEVTDEALAQSHTTLIRARLGASRERRLSKAMAMASLTAQGFLDGITEAVKGINTHKPDKPNRPPGVPKKGTPMTAELLLSDLQIGKLMVNYNTDIALRRLTGYTEAALFKIKQHMDSGYKMERIILAIMGDIIESDKKHPNSARATDTGTASQIRNAIEGLYSLVLKPLATFCESNRIKMEVIAVTG